MKEEVVNEFSIKLIKQIDEDCPYFVNYIYQCDTTRECLITNEITSNAAKSWMYSQLKKYFKQITK